MADSHLPLLVTRPSNIRYLTGFSGSAPEEREAYCLIHESVIYLFTNTLYTEQSQALPRSPTVNGVHKTLSVIEISRENPFSSRLSQIVRELHLSALEFEESDLTVAEHRKLVSVLPAVSFRPVQNRIETVRMTKRPDEIEAIRLASSLTDLCFTSVTGKLRCGVTESEIAWEIESFFRKNGAQNAFSPIVAFGKNSSMPHYSGISENADDAVLTAATGLVLLDFGARVHGYCSDMTRMVFVNTPAAQLSAAYAALAEAQAAAVSQAQHGERSGSTLDRTAISILHAHGYPPYPHSLGHALGLDIHELPRLSVKSDMVLAPGMTVTVEPGIYIPGHFGMRIEDTLLITATGAEILTQSPKELRTIRI